MDTDDVCYRRERNNFRTLCLAFAPKHTKAAIEESALREFDALIASGKFPLLAVQNETLLAKSRFVKISKDRNVYCLGEYLIDIGKGYFAAYNLTQIVSGCHHPHINKAGQFCMSDGREEIMSFIKEGWLGRALTSVEAALWQTGPGYPFPDAGLDQWPVEIGGSDDK